jgi:hypothetical protein
MVLNIKNNLHLSSLLSIHLAFVALTPGGYIQLFPSLLIHLTLLSIESRGVW